MTSKKVHNFSFWLGKLLVVNQEKILFNNILTLLIKYFNKNGF